MSKLRLSGHEDFIPSAEIRERTKELAAHYTDLYRGEEFVLLTVLNGAAVFGMELGQEIDNPDIIVDFARMRSMTGTRQEAPLYLVEPDVHIKDRNVLVVEDIDDTRYTLSTLLPRLRDHNPKRLDLVSLLNKPDADKVMETLPCDDVQYGFQIASRFVVGRGLDWEGKYRMLPHISVVENIALPGEPEFYVPVVYDERKVPASGNVLR
jgi:hypoxanthine phosphoribosyltransferase